MKTKIRDLVNSTTTKLRHLAPAAPETRALELETLTVTHESVVATLNIVAREKHSFIKIWWGDEGSNTQPITINLNRERIVPSNENLPVDTFRLQHRYDENTPSRKIIIVQSIDKDGGKTWETRVIEIDPIYKFICYPVVLEIENDFDTTFESNSEFEINMTIHQNNDLLFNNQWDESIDTTVNPLLESYPIAFTVAGSQYSKNILYSEEPIEIHFFIKERDNLLKDIFDALTTIPSDFDTSVRIPSKFHPKDYTGSKEFRVPYQLNDGRLSVLIRTEMRLSVPLDKTGELLTLG